MKDASDGAANSKSRFLCDTSIPITASIVVVGNPGGPLALVLGLMFAALFVIAGYNGSPKFFPIGAIIDGGLAAICFITAFRHIRKTEFYVFRNVGGAVVFEIGRRGPDCERFDQFAASIIARVHSLQEPKQ